MRYELTQEDTDKRLVKYADMTRYLQAAQPTDVFSIKLANDDVLSLLETAILLGEWQADNHSRDFSQNELDMVSNYKEIYNG